MKRISIIIGLAALCALALAAVGAAGASAAETTAWTCVSGGTGGLGHKFTDADCSVEENTKGTFGHQEIAVGTDTQITLSKKTNALFEFTAGAAAVKLEATGIECMSCMAKNTGSAGAMEVTGSGGTITFTGVTVVGQTAKCQIRQDQAPNALGVIQTEPLVFHTVATNEAKIEPVTPPVLATFEIIPVGTETCVPKGTYEVKGDVGGTTSGAILTVNIAKATKTLTVGALGASLTGQATIEAGEGAVHHAAALT